VRFLMVPRILHPPEMLRHPPATRRVEPDPAIVALEPVGPHLLIGEAAPPLGALIDVVLPHSVSVERCHAPEQPLTPNAFASAASELRKLCHAPCRGRYLMPSTLM
jgi:hypothetical protein